MSDRELRNLLLDCRTALRRHHKLFEDDPLRGKIDAALAALDKKGDEDELAQPETRTAQQVAYAWQIAARSLKLSHPDVYERLARKVREMLDTQVLHDPATEILALEHKLQATQAAQRTAHQELEQLRQALTEAMPLFGNDAAGSAIDCDLRRVQMLFKAATTGGGAGMPKPPAAVVADPFGLTHSRESLHAVARGLRGLSHGERSWCIAEAMVLSEKRESELRQLPDNELVNLVFAGAA